ncbi:MAG: ImmA/IrrE family metallo-endopeptidase [Sphingopyxis sp.]|nr:ImmA/IrrE family metallo-endopeptidase [Sphingopyxis sp.]
MIDAKQKEILDRYRSEVPVRIGALAADLGLDVRRASLSPKISGLIEPAEGDGFLIKVNKFESEERQRFTVAHEIAHFLLHRNLIKNGIVDSIMYRSALSSKHEVEANRLAADILMPYDAIESGLRELGSVRDEATATALARKFRVSLPAMKVRLRME